MNKQNVHSKKGLTLKLLLINTIISIQLTIHTLIKLHYNLQIEMYLRIIDKNCKRKSVLVINTTLIVKIVETQLRD